MTKHTLPRVGIRYVSGRPLDGTTRPGRRYLRHVAWRLGVPVAFCAAGVTYQAYPRATLATVTLLALVGTARAFRALRRAWRTRRFRGAYIRPVLAALGPALGDAPVRLRVDPDLGTLLPRLARPMSPAEAAVRARYGQHVEPVLRWLPDRVQRALWALQRGVRPLTRRLHVFRVPAQDAGPRIELQASVPYLTPEQRAYVSAVIGAKVPAGELVESWDQVGARVTATWTVRRRPPARVGYADLAARLPQLAEYEFFLGLGAAGRPVVISLRDDSPHIACSAGSGAGKSVLAQLVGVQVLARGGRVVILDLKGSHRWALGLPGVDYCTQPEQMHRALVRLEALAEQRNAAALHEAEDWDPGERVLIIAEELNATFSRLRDYWAEVRDKGPKVSPAVRGFRNLLFMGRSAKVNVFAVAQMLTANTTGGPESRENFGVRCLARYTRNAWQMLAPEAGMPRSSRTLGRWQVVVGGTATETQVCYLSAAEARLLVTKLSPVAHSPLIGAEQRMSPGHGPAGDASAPADPLSESVTLREAVDRAIVPWSFDAAKKRLQRARKAGTAAPVPVGKDGLADVYRVGDLIEWIESELVR